jgi:hypothetical protein
LIVQAERIGLASGLADVTMQLTRLIVAYFNGDVDHGDLYDKISTSMPYWTNYVVALEPFEAAKE